MTPKAKNSKVNPPAIVTGYGGTIPVKFRAISTHEKKRLGQIGEKKLASNVLNADPIKPEALLDFINIIFANNKYDLLDRVIAEALPKYPQMTLYLVDAVLKNVGTISPNMVVAKKIKDRFSKALVSQKHVPEYLALSYIRLLGHESFYDKEVLLKYYMDLKRDRGAFVGRATLEALMAGLTRDEVIEIRDGYDRADLWEKRQIVRLIKEHLSEAEVRPWLKNQGYIEKDLFIRETMNPSDKAATRKTRGRSRKKSP